MPHIHTYSFDQNSHIPKDIQVEPRASAGLVFTEEQLPPELREWRVVNNQLRVIKKHQLVRVGFPVWIV